MISLLNRLNDVRIHSVYTKTFDAYGRVISGFDFSALSDAEEKATDIPKSGNIYEPSLSILEEQPIFDDIKNIIYGGMDIQIGICNGMNTTYNGFEYHKGSEVNIAVTGFMLVLGHIWQINNNCFKVGDEKVFYVPKGTAIEMYQTTLHLSPCRISDDGFRDIVILPKGTNTPLSDKEKSVNSESKLLLMKNKWVIAHPEREPLIKQGAYPGLIGENKELKYK